ncbi:MAG: phage integrase N-terminal SAM-like domain-containing protein [Rhizobacter sp.]|nr:phage integrase N-terminal SAM-like domain-containing protein [Rhizobacter sp.]MBP6269652.1 phage integrase N-terminal SAM-like domain-containing protein [Rhizobacter sp.]
MPVSPLALPPRKNLQPELAASHLPPLRSVRVLDQLRERLRFMHYSLRTEEVYVYWTKAFIRFHGIRHPAAPAGVREALLLRGKELAVVQTAPMGQERSIRAVTTGVTQSSWCLPHPTQPQNLCTSMLYLRNA